MFPEDRRGFTEHFSKIWTSPPAHHVHMHVCMYVSVYVMYICTVERQLRVFPSVDRGDKEK